MILGDHSTATLCATSNGIMMDCISSSRGRFKLITMTCTRRSDGIRCSFN